MKEQEMKIEDFFADAANGGIYEIETPQGWVKIGDLYRKYNKKCYEIKTENYSLKCSFDHLVMTNNNWKLTENLSLGDFIETKTGFEQILEKTDIGISDVYDLEVLSEEHAYYSNDIVSHNTAKTTCINEFSKIPVTWRGKTYPGYKVVCVPIAQYEEMGDLLGLPARHVCMACKTKITKKEYETLKSENKNVSERNGDYFEITEEWVPEQCVDGYKDLGWEFLPQRGIRTLCAPPAWVPTEEVPTILFFDDWNRASLRIIKGIMQLLQTYGTVTWKLPAGCHIVLTANPDDQDYQVTSIDKAVITRLRNTTMRFDVKEWSVWAQDQGLDGRGITWALQNFDMMLGKEQTNPRTLAETFRMTKDIGDINEKKNEIEFRRVAGSLLDEDTVNQMVIYFQKDVGLVAEPERILNGDSINGKSIAAYVDALINKKNGNEARTDIVGVLCDRLFAYIHQDTVEATPKFVKNFQDFIVLESIPEDIRFGLVTRICKCKANTRLTKWIIGNKKLAEILKTVFQCDS